MAIQNSSALTAPGSSTLSLQVSSVDDLARLARVFAASGLFGRAGNQETQVAECAMFPINRCHQRVVTLVAECSRRDPRCFQSIGVTNEW
jgi:hypothetical protein